MADLPTDEARRALDLADRIDRAIVPQRLRGDPDIKVIASWETWQQILASLRAKTDGGAEDRPSPGLLMSMAMRYDHAIGHAGFYDRKPAGIGKPGSDPGGHARRLSGTMNSMRQLWEEAVGCGFYAPHKEADYRALAETCGVTFLDSGFAVVSRANDERAQREDPKGLSPKDASVMTEGQAPQSSPTPTDHVTEETRDAS